MGKDRVCYFYDSKHRWLEIPCPGKKPSSGIRVFSGELEEIYYGANHPMKPPRLCMAHHLVLGYDLHKHLEVYVSWPTLCLTR